MQSYNGIYRITRNVMEFVDSRYGLVSINIKPQKHFKYESCMFCISVNEWHRRAVSFTAHTHTEARAARGVFSVCRLTKWGHKYMNNIPRTARRVTSWAFDRFIWVKRSSYHIYIGYRNLKGPHGNLSKYKFGLAEYITVYVIQLQQLLQLLLRISTQYAKYVYF